MTLVISLCLHRAPIAAYANSGAIYLAIPTPSGRMLSLRLSSASLVARVDPFGPCGL